MERAKPSQNVTTFMLSLGQDRMMRSMPLGLEAAAEQASGTLDVLHYFLKTYPQQAQRMAMAMGLPTGDLVKAFADPPPTQEPKGDGVLRYTDSEGLDQSYQLSSTAFAIPLRTAMRQAGEALADGGLYPVGELIYQVAMVDGEARVALLELGPADKVELAVESVRSFEPETADPLAMLGNIDELLEAAWPSVLKEQEEMMARHGGDKLRELKEKLYSEQPERYESSLNLQEEFQNPAPEGEEFMARAGICLHAAENEARIRKAPEVKLDHLLVALLQDGTDTSAYLDQRGIDRVAIRQALDSELPRYPEGPRWPPNARDLTMQIPEDGRTTRILRDVPEDLNISSLSKEERATYFETKPGTRTFTDLYWLKGVMSEKRTIGYRLLSAAGVSLDEILARLRVHETGDEEWHNRLPNLAQAFKDDKGVMPGYQLSTACVEAAQFEARRKKAPAVTVDHMVLALLREGTDTNELVRDLELDPQRLFDEIDAIVPTGPGGPFFPEPEDPLLTIGLLGQGPSCSDLMLLADWLDPDSRQVQSAALELLVAQGVTLRAVQDRLRSLGMELEG